jgi:predicted transcriptional regulator
MLFGCDEWKRLTPRAKILYLYIKAKYNGSNNGCIRLYYSELKGVKGFSSHGAISRAFKELEEKNWIRRKQIGGLYRHINDYELIGKYDGML